MDLGLNIDIPAAGDEGNHGDNEALVVMNEGGKSDKDKNLDEW